MTTTRQRPWISDDGFALMHKLAQGLAMKVPDENFYMGSWGIGQPHEIASFDCGTAACAMGHAAWLLAPRLTTDGLEFFVDGKRVGEFGGGDGFDAARVLFGISRAATVVLFGNFPGLTRLQVAADLARFADTGKLPVRVAA